MLSAPRHPRRRSHSLRPAAARRLRRGRPRSRRRRPHLPHRGRLESDDSNFERSLTGLSPALLFAHYASASPEERFRGSVKNRRWRPTSSIGVRSTADELLPRATADAFARRRFTASTAPEKEMPPPAPLLAPRSGPSFRGGGLPTGAEEQVKRASYLHGATNLSFLVQRWRLVLFSIPIAGFFIGLRCGPSPPRARAPCAPHFVQSRHRAARHCRRAASAAAPLLSPFR
jgi:hypothetical protein